MPTSIAEGDSGRVRILLVDDDRAALDSLEAVLLADFDVVACASPWRSLEIARTEIARLHPFDVVCADFQMPEMDGVELLERMTRLEDRPSTILITGHSELLRGEHRRAAHVLGIVMKPYDPEHVIGLVGRLGRATQLRRTVTNLAQRVRQRRA